jgi:hypothetical protein
MNNKSDNSLYTKYLDGVNNIKEFLKIFDQYRIEFEKKLFDKLPSEEETDEKIDKLLENNTLEVVEKKLIDDADATFFTYLTEYINIKQNDILDKFNTGKFTQEQMKTHFDALKVFSDYYKEETNEF